ncbi:hypothetical protein Clacol_009301 [Clathrus columnatus]|uniref:Flavin-containing monooxygenase n=1 Tax=Clathrus columnatus TaxID=1419009 RepID=A0AAV5AQR0_9AGAM|nr:hypothetical protein Clacol_009301 [Clathrus columnatus]
MPLKVGVIGGGAAGLAALKILKDTDEITNGDWVVTAFEQRDDIGGIWYVKLRTNKKFLTTTLRACRYPSPPVGDPPATPLYDALTTNIPHILMAFPSFLFKPSTPLYPSSHVVLEYLRDYAKYFGVREYIQLCSTVEECKWDGEERVWILHVRSFEQSTSTSKLTVHKFDKLIIANGHFSTPRYPSLPGLLNWRHPPIIPSRPRATHSIYFRNPTPYKDKRVIVIGGGPSGMDITTELCKVASVVYHSSSTTTVPFSATIGSCTLINRGRVTALHEDGTVSFDDSEKDKPSMELDHAILATGYEMSFPFLEPLILKKALLPDQSDIIPSELINTTSSVYPLTRHILPFTKPTHEISPWHVDPSSIAFIGLPIKVTPFPLFETQVTYLVSLYRNPDLFSPSLEQAWIEHRYISLKERFHLPAFMAKNMHIFVIDEQYAYTTEILRLAGVPQDSHIYPEIWTKDIYAQKNVLRRIWKLLEREGKAEEVVRGVGSSPGKAGREEWAELAKVLIREYESKMAVIRTVVRSSYINK